MEVIVVVGGSIRQIQGSYGYPGQCMELRWVSRSRRRQGEKRVSMSAKKVPIYISTNPSHINPEELRDLYRASNHSCHRFPNYVVDTESESEELRVEPVDIHKLRTALSHSSVIVSVFCKPTDNSSSEIPTKGLTDLFQKVMPVSPFNGHLVGFGRAVSDFGLTASIYDVMVRISHPRGPHSTYYQIAFSCHSLIAPFFLYLMSTSD